MADSSESLKPARFFSTRVIPCGLSLRHASKSFVETWPSSESGGRRQVECAGTADTRGQAPAETVGEWTTADGVCEHGRHPCLKLPLWPSQRSRTQRARSVFATSSRTRAHRSMALPVRVAGLWVTVSGAGTRGPVLFREGQQREDTEK